MAKLRFGFVSLCLLASACGCDKTETPARPPGPPVVVYAAGDAESMRAALDAYSAESGISVLLTTETGRALVDRISAEKHRATADLFISDSIGHLWTAVERDILRPSNSELLRNNVPAKLRDEENLWFGLGFTTRTIVYDKRSIDPANLTDYADLANQEWHGKLCLTSSAHADNRSQIAMMIAENGDRPTESILRSWIANLAIPVVPDSARLLQEIDDGRCGLGIVNSDEAEGHARQNPGTSLATFLPPASSGGAHIDIVGAAVTRHAGNPAGALHLLEWLSSAKAQKMLAGETIDGRTRPASLARAGYYHEDAVRLMERVRWRR